MTYKELFQINEPNNQTIDILCKGDDVDDLIPEEMEVVKALFHLNNRKAPGMTGITADFLKTWYYMSHPKEGDGDTGARALEN